MIAVYENGECAFFLGAERFNTVSNNRLIHMRRNVMPHNMQRRKHKPRPSHTKSHSGTALEGRKGRERKREREKVRPLDNLLRPFLIETPRYHDAILFALVDDSIAVSAFFETYAGG